jgi:hypothetical protein
MMYSEKWFALMSIKGGALGVYAFKREAESAREEAFFSREHKIIPCTITYSLPAKKKRA